VQRGTALVIILCAAEALVIALAFSTGQRWGALIVTVAVAALLAVTIIFFLTMTIDVSPGALELTMLRGRLQRRWDLTEVRTAQVVRVPWYHGLGIHTFGRTWVFNVSGRRAVELAFGDGSRVVLGSDQPEQLLEAVQAACLAA
jgi:hypothetical protein